VDEVKESKQSLSVYLPDSSGELYQLKNTESEFSLDNAKSKITWDALMARHYPA
jgi:hypothetical protein